jgi:hypothetical protein
MATWPATAHELTQLQQALGEMTPGRWQPPTTVLRIGACFVCFERVHGAGAAGNRGFAGAAVTYRRRLLAGVTASGSAGGPYLPNLLALREGPLLEQAARPAARPRSCWSTPPAATIPAAPALPSTLAPCLACLRSGGDHPAAARPGRLGPSTNAPRRHRCCWMARWSATGSGPGRAPSR